MGWVRKEKLGWIRTKVWEGPPPNKLYHFGSEKSVQRIAEESTMRTHSAVGMGLGIPRTISFTSDPVRLAGWMATSCFYGTAGLIEVEYEGIGPPRPVPAVYTFNPKRVGGLDLSRSNPARSRTLGFESEWFVPAGEVRLREGSFRVLSPVRLWPRGRAMETVSRLIGDE